MLTLQYAYSYGATIQEARRLEESEKARYKPEYANSIFVCVGNETSLDMIAFTDVPSRKPDGEFNGCANLAWIITEAERDALIALNEKRKKEKAAADLETEISTIKRIIAKCETQRDLPSRAEAKRRMERYNDINNEGGEGYVPHIYSLEEYEYYKKRLEALMSMREGGGNAKG